jgi:hypothetical protein
VPILWIHALILEPGLDSAFRRLEGLVEEKGFADVFYLGYRALEVEGL